MTPITYDAGCIRLVPVPAPTSLLMTTGHRPYLLLTDPELSAHDQADVPPSEL